MTRLSEGRCEACDAGAAPVVAEERERWLQEIPHWALVNLDTVPKLERVFKFENFIQALDFTNRVGALAEEQNHHPALLTEWGRVTVRWWTHKITNLHRNDFIMAARCDRLAPHD
ncbi:4a-hydroxytetrahydrobiopterin dehydratase [bacterium CPR1]|nr:4a-hydroxytetrahydrobiopterin dehydratase [bacterium CPR1]